MRKYSYKHSIKEIFYRADEMKQHPLHWEWKHPYTKSSYYHQFLWLIYYIRCKFFPNLILKNKRPGY